MNLIKDGEKLLSLWDNFTESGLKSVPSEILRDQEKIPPELFSAYQRELQNIMKGGSRDKDFDLDKLLDENKKPTDIDAYYGGITIGILYRIASVTLNKLTYKNHPSFNTKTMKEIQSNAKETLSFLGNFMSETTKKEPSFFTNFQKGYAEGLSKAINSHGQYIGTSPNFYLISYLTIHWWKIQNLPSVSALYKIVKSNKLYNYPYESFQRFCKRHGIVLRKRGRPKNRT
ncbi:MAG: hypothetical protein SGI98_11315 [Verrucomicrobiota bacterium]|nr:hypothetical protein [Verrucomicrobiota bacterium]